MGEIQQCLCTVLLALKQMDFDELVTLSELLWGVYDGLVEGWGFVGC